MKLYCFWLGDNVMSDARFSALNSMGNSGLEVTLVHSRLIYDFVDKKDIHPAFGFLSHAHKADYLRSLFMHRLGGGYSDIKWIDRSWIPSIESWLQTDNYGLGYAETRMIDAANPHSAAVHLGKPKRECARAFCRKWVLRIQYRHLLGNCAFVFRPNSTFTSSWFNEVWRRLDGLHENLEKYPARYPREGAGMTFDGKLTNYPVPWTYLLGDIFHELCLTNRHSLSYNLPKISLSNLVYESYI